MAAFQALVYGAFGSCTLYIAVFVVNAYGAFAGLLTFIGSIVIGGILAQIVIIGARLCQLIFSKMTNRIKK